MFLKSKNPGLIACLLLCGFSSGLLAQSGTGSSSPYSRYGIGDLQFRGFTKNIAMGSLGQGLSSSNSINFLNPASYSAITLTTFEAGLSSNFVTYSTSSLSQKNNNSTLAYLALAFPISKKWGTSIGLLPYSNVGYHINTSEKKDSIGNVTYDYTGSGGINEVYFGNAFAITPRLSLGLNISYLFGSINRVRTIDFPDYSSPFNVRVTNTTSVGGFLLSYGLQYSIPLKKDYTLVLGLSGAMSSNVTATSSEMDERFFRSGTYIIPKDTLPATADVKGSLTFPSRISGGVLIKNSKLQAGIDYTMQSWSNYKEFGVAADNLSNSSLIALGGQYIPNADASRNYFKVVAYRLGARYSQTYLQLNGTQLNEYALTAGLGLPIPRSQTNVNISMEYGQRGTTSNDLIREQYVRFTIGLTFNDKWFVRRKID